MVSGVSDSSRRFASCTIPVLAALLATSGGCSGEPVTRGGEPLGSQTQAATVPSCDCPLGSKACTPEVDVGYCQSSSKGYLQVSDCDLATCQTNWKTVRVSCTGSYPNCGTWHWSSGVTCKGWKYLSWTERVCQVNYEESSIDGTCFAIAPHAGTPGYEITLDDCSTGLPCQGNCAGTPVVTLPPDAENAYPHCGTQGQKQGLPVACTGPQPSPDPVF
jgi:hypothetical protein